VASSPQRPRPHQQAFLYPAQGAGDSAPVPRPAFLPPQPEEEEQPEEEQQGGGDYEVGEASSEEEERLFAAEEARVRSITFPAEGHRDYLGRISCCICGSVTHLPDSCIGRRTALSRTVGTQTGEENRGPCRYWQQGHCRRGEACWYAHVPEQEGVARVEASRSRRARAASIVGRSLYVLARLVGPQRIVRTVLWAVRSSGFRVTISGATLAAIAPLILQVREYLYGDGDS